MCDIKYQIRELRKRSLMTLWPGYFIMLIQIGASIHTYTQIYHILDMKGDITTCAYWQGYPA